MQIICINVINVNTYVFVLIMPIMVFMLIKWNIRILLWKLLKSYVLNILV